MTVPYTQNLGGIGWRFGDVPQQPPSFAGDDRGRVGTWREALVPGHVHADLLDHDLIDDPDVAGAIERCRWVNHRDWWYERDVELALRPGRRAFLEFRGIDYLADVWWHTRNRGRRLVRHEGQFVTQHLEVTHDVPRDGRTRMHTLAVRLWGAAGWPQPDWPIIDRLWAPLARRLYDGTESVTPYHRRLGLLRNQMSFGWDFAPELVAPGIWDDVTLTVTGDVHIVDAWVRSDPQRPMLVLEVDATRPHDTSLEVTWAPLDGTGGTADGCRAKVDVRPGRQRVAIPLALGEPALWQPWEHGRPHRYRLHVRVHDEDGVSDERELTFGLRRIVWDGWKLYVNGKRLFVRGVNWVPADLLPGRLRREDYADLLERAVAAGVNLIRVWGGGLREKRAFYELCDELGLLVWQEFPFACAFLDRYPTTPAFLHRVERTADDVVRAVRGHPSLALWGAGNEYGPVRHRRLVARLARAVETHDGTRPLYPPSPSTGESHNWNVWHGYAPIRDYLRETAAMVSEFGLQALPALETLAAAEGDEALWPPGTAWERRYGEVGKLARYADVTASTQPSSLDDYVIASQEAQARGLQTMIEHQRRRRGGVSVWQFNEPWPAISWALVDHYGRPKAAYRMLARLYSPLLLSLKYPLRPYRSGDRFYVELWAINDLPRDVNDAEARVYHAGTCVVTLPLTMPAGTARPVHELHLTLGEPLVFRVELWRGERRITWVDYDLTCYDSGSMPARARLRRRLGELVMRI